MQWFSFTHKYYRNIMENWQKSWKVSLINSPENPGTRRNSMLKYKFFIKFRKFTALRNKHDVSVPAIWVQHKIFSLGRFQKIKKYAQLLLKQIFELLGIYIWLMPRWDIIKSIGKLFVCPF